MQQITLTDKSGDTLDVQVTWSGALDFTTDEDGDYACVQFTRPEDSDKVRQLRDLITEWLGDAPSNGVAASSITFNEGVLRLAAVHEKTVEFSYAKGKGDVIERRRLVPEKVEEGRDGSLRFVGYDPDRDDVRAYRVDRIKGEIRVAA